MDALCKNGLVRIHFYPNISLCECLATQRYCQAFPKCEKKSAGTTLNDLDRGACVWGQESNKGPDNPG